MSADEVVGLEQGTEQWLRWREGGVGSSDATALMGHFGGIARKEREKDRAPNARMQRGTALEPFARVMFIELTGKFIMPGCYQSKSHPFMRASLDGISEDRKLVVEIKSPSWKVHDLALRGQVVNYYRPQCQHQLFVCGLESMLFFSYFPDAESDSEKYAFVRVDRDPVMQAQILERAEAYMRDKKLGGDA